MNESPECTKCGDWYTLDDREPAPHGMCWLCASEEVLVLNGKVSDLELENDELRKALERVIREDGCAYSAMNEYDGCKTSGFFAPKGCGVCGARDLLGTPFKRNDKCGVALPYGQSGVPDFCTMENPCPVHPKAGENYNDLGAETDKD